MNGGEPACFTPAFIEGRVFDAADDKGIEGATVVALDANGGARTTVVRTGAAGDYSLPISLPRTADGTPLQEAVKLRVAAFGYQPFPLAPREALPIDLAQAAAKDGRLVAATAATDVALLALPSGGAGLGTIEGKVSFGDNSKLTIGGVLVVAEAGGKAVSTAVTDSGGNFSLFNVPPGTVKVGGYRQGLNVEDLKGVFQFAP